MKRVAALGAAAFLVSGCGDSPGAPKLERTTLLVSGRDDHGLLAQPSVELRRSPDGPVAASLLDGTLVRVLEARGEWLRVRALEGARSDGWVNDYYLRGTVHVVAPNGCAAAASGAPGARPTRALARNVQAELLGVAIRGGRTWVRVRTLVSRTAAWVDRRAVRELPELRGCR